MLFIYNMTFIVYRHEKVAWMAGRNVFRCWYNLADPRWKYWH